MIQEDACVFTINSWVFSLSLIKYISLCIILIWVWKRLFSEISWSTVDDECLLVNIFSVVSEPIPAHFILPYLWRIILQIRNRIIPLFYCFSFSTSYFQFIILMCILFSSFYWLSTGFSCFHLFLSYLNNLNFSYFIVFYL